MYQKYKYQYPSRDGTDANNDYVKLKFKIGDSVYYKSETPLDALRRKQPRTLEVIIVKNL